MGASKPYDAEVEYLENTSGSYIVTGIVPDANTGALVECTAINNTDGVVFGLREDSGNTRWLIGRDTNYYNGYGLYQNSNIKVLTKVSVALNYLNNKKWSVNNNGDITQFNLQNLSFTPVSPIYIFARGGQTGNLNNWKGKIHSFKISQGSTIVMDLIPVRVGQVGYMYDKVSGELFGNSGNGNFVLGNDIQRIEYIESTGNEYLDFGFTGNNYDWHITAQTTDIGSSNGILLCRSDNAGNWFGSIYSVGGVWGLSYTDGAYSSISSTTKQDLIIKIRDTTSEATVGNESLTKQSSEQTSTFNLFAVKYTGSISAPIKARVWSVKCYQNNNLILYAVPVRVGQVGYLYDLISNTLFGNLWTGAFVLGPDV